MSYRRKKTLQTTGDGWRVGVPAGQDRWIRHRVHDPVSATRSGSLGRNTRTRGRSWTIVRRTSVRHPARTRNPTPGGRSGGSHRLGTGTRRWSPPSADSTRNRPGSRLRPGAPAGTGTPRAQVSRKSRHPSVQKSFEKQTGSWWDKSKQRPSILPSFHPRHCWV